LRARSGTLLWLPLLFTDWLTDSIIQKVCENRVLKRTLTSTYKEEVQGSWRKLHSNTFILLIFTKCY
jgi:hypothetical protein